MARINFDDDVEKQEEFWKLFEIVKDRDACLGKLVRFFRLAQEKFGHGELITEDELRAAGLEVMIQAKWAIEVEPGKYKAKGAEDHFGWYRQRVDAGKKRADSNSNRDEKGQFKSSGTPAEHQRAPAVDQPLSLALALSKKEYSDEFLWIWGKYPQGGKAEAAKRFEKYIPPGKRREFADAMLRYLEDCKASGRYLKDLSTFIGSARSGHPWQEWVGRVPGAQAPPVVNPVQKILDAVPRFHAGRQLLGDDWEAHKEKIRAAIGEDAWALVVKFGGWQKVHENANNVVWLRQQLNGK